MDHIHAVLDSLLPVVLLLLFGVIAAVACRAARLSPIVGYLALGILLHASGVDGASATIALLAELGVVFLLFDIGLHFSLNHLREQARDIFGFGPVQVALGALGLGLGGLILGLAPLPAFLLGATLALSSTAVVAGLLAQRRQQNCPVGLTATAILIFQDVAAIFLLIIVNAIGGESGPMAPQLFLAVVKAAAAFGVAFALARLVVRPLFDLIARTDNAEVFTASALLVALAASWATGSIGLSLTLGGFLGGMIIAETPYRPIIQAETKPFRNLLLSFFFISVGLSLDLNALSQNWLAILGVTIALIAIKIVTNGVSSLIFRWSIPGSTQLGFLLAQGSEFAFVILSMPTMRLLIGDRAAAIIISAVALSLALTPAIAKLGRKLAGKMRARRAARQERELLQSELAAPVLIIGMGRVGRTVADALSEFDIGYAAIEADQKTFADANADGYEVLFGDAADPRIWEPLNVRERKIVVITTPDLQISRELTPLAALAFPHIKRFTLAANEAEHAAFAAIGLLPVIDASTPPGLDLAVALLVELGIDRAAAEAWALEHEARARESVVAAEAAE
ncbi:sodium/hydrogen exchanger [Methylocella silvestris BL2]|uniref:Sodium/hydrogen exchanger n=1 Tax=Methylocella silvestris (strain DSM 15510 / CIP 108128 / LMG 27833 / NCIMB 13906 / BL2) TaxID=395965 RepID=B8EIE3_METSB|nr:cation:proton antiporter [Methylocella silvestris]ACK51262.1 sodium/hydrogen exchanger [Methylocella silvestris BL2]